MSIARQSEPSRAARFPESSQILLGLRTHQYVSDNTFGVNQECGGEHAGSLDTEIGAGVLLKEFKANAQLGCLLGQCLSLLSVVIHGKNRER